MKRIAITVTQDQIKASMKQVIKSNLDDIKAAIIDPNLSQTIKAQKIDDLITRLNSIIDTQITALNATATPTATIQPPTTLAADDGNTNDVSICPLCDRKMKYSDGRDAYMCVPCGYVGENGPAKNKRSTMWRRNLDYGSKE